MIKINKVWSKENRFKKIEFKAGLNFIVGDKSDGDDPVSEQRNGSGKSLSIELINFVLMKRSNESKIFKIPDSFLPENSFVYMELVINNQIVTIARNKKQEVKMSINGAPEQAVSEATAKKELENLIGLSEEISLRDIFNFIIKESDYTYKKFLNFFHTNSFNRIKTSLYFFDFPIDTFQRIKSIQEDFEGMKSARALNRKQIEQKGLTIEALKSKQIDLEYEIENLKENLSYENISQKISEDSRNLEELEDDLLSLNRRKGRILYQLEEVNEFLRNEVEEVLIEEDELTSFFNNYVKGLGDFVKTDLNSLREFKQKISVFEDEMVVKQRENLNQSLSIIENEILNTTEDVKQYEKFIKKGNNFLQRGLETSSQIINNFNDNKQIISEFDRLERELIRLKSDFHELYQELYKEFTKISSRDNSFRRTLLDIHEKIYHDKSATFTIDVDLNGKIENKEFFNIDIQLKRQGSEGVNRMRQIIYDLTLMANEYTSERSQNLLIHDRLICGDIDDITTIETLNYMYSLDPETFQYIGTYNTDCLSEEKMKKLDFDIEEKQRIRLTVKDPIFHSQFNEAIDYDEELESK